jgi:hypothetical protein
VTPSRDLGSKVLPQPHIATKIAGSAPGCVDRAAFANRVEINASPLRKLDRTPIVSRIRHANIDPDRRHCRWNR